MQKAALAVQNHTDQVTQDTWLTTRAHEDIERHLKEVKTLQQQLRQLLQHEGVHSMLKKARHALCNCVTRHKGIHRRKLTNTAVRCGNAKQGEALAALAKGHDLSLQQPARQKPPISPTIFTAHFEQLFSKTSDHQTLGLMEEKAGPKTPLRLELSGDPTLLEVQTAVKGVSRGTAPGNNGLRPELFKLGGDALANRLVKDFAVLWPSETELETAAPSPP